MKNPQFSKLNRKYPIHRAQPKIPKINTNKKFRNLHNQKCQNSVGKGKTNLKNAISINGTIKERLNTWEIEVATQNLK